MKFPIVDQFTESDLPPLTTMPTPKKQKPQPEEAVPVPTPVPTPPWVVEPKAKAGIDDLIQEAKDYVDLLSQLDGASPEMKPSEEEFEGMPIKTKKPKPAPVDPQLNPKTRKSCFGQKFIFSSEQDWKQVDGFWYHESESDHFDEKYTKSSISGKGFLIDHNSLRTIGFGDGGHGYITKQEYEENKETIGRCQHWETYTPKKNLVSARNKNNEEIFISKQAFEADFIKCARTGNFFHGAAMSTVKNCKAYPPETRISRWAVNQYPKEFGFCCNCCRVFDPDLVFVPTDVSPMQQHCKPCYTKKKYKNVIKAYNDKSHTDPIYTVEERLSANNILGQIHATMTKAEVDSIPRLFGAEAEVELARKACERLGLTRHSMAIALIECLGSDFITAKEDGSLVENGKYSGDSKYDPDGTKNGPVYAGFEIVTGPCDIAAHRSRWYRLADCKEIRDENGNNLLRAWDTTTCGFHVHVSRAVLNDLQIGRMLKFINHTGNAKFIHKMAGRGSDKYCRYIEKEVVDSRHPERVISPEEASAYDRNRRVALNLSNEKTVEFRIFRGTIHPNHIMRNLLFCDAMVDFTQPAGRSLKDMEKYGEFIYFISKNVKRYPELAAWLYQQKHLAMKKHAEGIDISKFTIQPDMVAEPVHSDQEPPPPPKPATPKKSAKKPEPTETESF